MAAVRLFLLTVFEQKGSRALTSQHGGNTHLQVQGSSRHIIRHSPKAWCQKKAGRVHQSFRCRTLQQSTLLDPACVGKMVSAHQGGSASGCAVKQQLARCICILCRGTALPGLQPELGSPTSSACLQCSLGGLTFTILVMVSSSIELPATHPMPNKSHPAVQAQGSWYPGGGACVVSLDCTDCKYWP